MISKASRKVERDEKRRGALRASFMASLRQQLGAVVDEALDIADAAADQMGKRYLSDRLPPVLRPGEEATTCEGLGDLALADSGGRLKKMLLTRTAPEGRGAGGANAAKAAKAAVTVVSTGGGAEASGDRALGGFRGGRAGGWRYRYRLRPVRRGVARLVIEDGACVVYHCLDNARWHHGSEMRPLEFPLDDAPAIEALLFGCYPPLEPIALGDLPHPASSEDLETKADIACALFQEGFLQLVDSHEDDLLLQRGSGNDDNDENDENDDDDDDDDDEEDDEEDEDEEEEEEAEKIDEEDVKEEDDEDEEEDEEEDGFVGNDDSEDEEDEVEYCKEPVYPYAGSDKDSDESSELSVDKEKETSKQGKKRQRVQDGVEAGGRAEDKNTNKKNKKDGNDKKRVTVEYNDDDDDDDDDDEEVFAPKDEEEYRAAIVQYLHRHGTTTLVKLGSAIKKPKQVKKSLSKFVSSIKATKGKRNGTTLQVEDGSVYLIQRSNY